MNDESVEIQRSGRQVAPGGRSLSKLHVLPIMQCAHIHACAAKHCCDWQHMHDRNWTNGERAPTIAAVYRDTSLPTKLSCAFTESSRAVKCGTNLLVSHLRCHRAVSKNKSRMAVMAKPMRSIECCGNSDDQDIAALCDRYFLDYDSVHPRLKSRIGNLGKSSTDGIRWVAQNRDN